MMERLSKALASALGHRHFAAQKDVRFTPESGHVQCTSEVPIADITPIIRSLRRQSKLDRLILLGQCFATLRLITNSNLLHRTIGRSAGFSPLRMRPGRYPLAGSPRRDSSVTH